MHHYRALLLFTPCVHHHSTLHVLGGTLLECKLSGITVWRNPCPAVQAVHTMWVGNWHAQPGMSNKGCCQIVMPYILFT